MNDEQRKRAAGDLMRADIKASVRPSVELPDGVIDQLEADLAGVVEAGSIDIKTGKGLSARRYGRIVVAMEHERSLPVSSRIKVAGEGALYFKVRGDWLSAAVAYDDAKLVQELGDIDFTGKAASNNALQAFTDRASEQLRAGQLLGAVAEAIRKVIASER